MGHGSWSCLLPIELDAPYIIELFCKVSQTWGYWIPVLLNEIGDEIKSQDGNSTQGKKIGGQTGFLN